MNWGQLLGYKHLESGMTACLLNDDIIGLQNSYDNIEQICVGDWNDILNGADPITDGWKIHWLYEE